MNKISNNLILELHVPDFNKARLFYKIFGFEQIMYNPESGGSSDLEYMVLERKDKLGRTVINFYGNKPKVAEHTHFREFSRNTPRGYAVEITIPVSDVEKLWGSVSKALDASQISQALAMKRWEKKDFRVIDPFGFYLRFTELVDWGQ